MSADGSLACTELTKVFGGVRALDGVSLSFGQDETVGVIGPNGSGKTTLFNLLVGYMKPSAGSVQWGGRPITGHAPHRIARAGVVRTFQGAEVLGGLTVTEAVRFGARLGRRRGDTLGERELLETVGLTDVAVVEAGALPYGHQKLLGVAMALATAPKLLLLDEPAAGLNALEVERFLALIGTVRRELGIGVGIIDHDMTLMMAVCDRVAVLDFGAVIAAGTPAQIQRDERVLEIYLGGDVRATP